MEESGADHTPLWVNSRCNGPRPRGAKVRTLRVNDHVDLTVRSTPVQGRAGLEACRNPPGRHGPRRTAVRRLALAHKSLSSREAHRQLRTCPYGNERADHMIGHRPATRIFAAAIFALLFTSEARAGVTSLLITGDSGDYISGGQLLFFTPSDGALTARANVSNGVSVAFN